MGESLTISMLVAMAVATSPPGLEALRSGQTVEARVPLAQQTLRIDTNAPSRAKRMAIGLVAGGITGGLIGRTLEDGFCFQKELDHGNCSRKTQSIEGAIVGAAVGTAIGFLFSL